MDIAGIILKYILQGGDEVLEVWNKLRIPYFKGSYSSIFGHITKFYNDHSRLPTLTEIQVSTREPTLKANIAAISAIEIPDDIGLDILLESLINEYAQNETIDKLDKFADNLIMMSAEEIKENLSEIVLYLDEKTHTGEDIFTMDSVSISDTISDSDIIRLKLNDTLETHSGGFRSSDLILLGGYRGSGKSVIAANITANQWLQGNVAPYFSIEMPGTEVYERHMSILSGVDAINIRNRTLSEDEYRKIASIKHKFFIDGYEVFDEYIKDGLSFADFERKLHRKSLNKNNQLVIIDNRDLTLSDIDMHMHKLKAQYGDKFKVCVVDYINQITSNTLDTTMYDWKYQIELAKKLKNLARKYEVCVFSPYQIDQSGEARFSKGLLDAADAAFISKPGPDHIKFEISKVRGFKAIEFASVMDWDSLKLYSEDFVDIPEINPEDDDLNI